MNKMSTFIEEIKIALQFVLRLLPRITFMVLGFSPAKYDARTIAYSWAMFLLPASAIFYMMINFTGNEFNRVLWIQIFSRGVFIINIFANFTHTLMFSIQRRTLNSQIFEEGRYLSAFGKLDLSVMMSAYSSFVVTIVTPGRYEIWLYAMILCHSMFSNYIVTCQFCVALKYHQIKIRNLKGSLAKCSNIASVEKCITKFDDVLNSLSTLNVLFGFQMLFVMTGIMGTMSISSFYFAKLAVAVGQRISLNLLGYLAHGVLVRLLMLIYANNYCDQTLKSIQAFYDELFLVLWSDDELRRSIELRLFLQLRKTSKFTAGGFFHLGNHVISSILAAATTYFSVLLQFSNASS